MVNPLIAPFNGSTVASAVACTPAGSEGAAMATTASGTVNGLLA